MTRVAIGSIAKVVNGATPSTEHPEYYDGDIIWATTKDLSNQNSKYFCHGERTITKKGYDSCSTEMIPAGNILMSSRAPIGLLAINTIDCCTNQGFKSLVIDSEKCDVEYLYYYLKYHIKEIEALGSGTTFKEVSKASMEQYEVDLPDIDTQKSIAKALTILDAKTINNNKISSELENIAKTIYDYWFLQFDFPNEDGRPFKSSGGKMVWNEALKREIPEGWELKTLNDIISQDKYAIVDGPFGTQMKISEYVSEGVPVYEMEQLNGRFIVDKPKHFLTEKKYEEVKRSTARNGDIIISKTGTLGLLGIVESEYEKGIIVSRLAKITPDENKVGKFFLLMYLQDLKNAGYWNQKSGGSTMPILNNTILENVPFLMSNNQVHKRFEEKVTPLFMKMKECQEENQSLSSLRDWLLPMLMNGQVTLKGTKNELG